MAKEFQSLLLEDLGIRWPGFRIRRIALNQHMPRVERFSEHVHPFTQWLLYLRGEGIQHLDDRSVGVRRGTVLAIPPGRRHRFEKARPVRPLCLAVDLDLDLDLPGSEEGRESARVGEGDLAGIERCLVSLHEISRDRVASPIATAALVLDLIARLERALAPRASSGPEGPVMAAIRAAVRRRGFAGLGPGVIARELGRGADHLNRQIRAEAGTTLGACLNQLRFEAAAEWLRDPSLSIGEVGARVGIDDQNYFARWFHKRVGQSPSRWRETMRHGEPSKLSGQDL